MKITGKKIATTLIVLISEATAFSTHTHAGIGTHRGISVCPRIVSTARAFKDERQSTSFLLEEFTTYTGEVVQPYDILGVDREAERFEIRRAYIEKSKLYHPDAIRHNDELPSECQSADDVRDEWERIKFSYEIISDRKTRMRYDRHASLVEVLEDPSAVVARAAGAAVKAGAQNLGKSIFDVGTFAVEQLTKKHRS